MHTYEQRSPGASPNDRVDKVYSTTRSALLCKGEELLYKTRSARRKDHLHGAIALLWQSCPQICIITGVLPSCGAQLNTLHSSFLDLLKAIEGEMSARSCRHHQKPVLARNDSFIALDNMTLIIKANQFLSNMQPAIVEKCENASTITPTLRTFRAVNKQTWTKSRLEALRDHANGDQNIELCSMFLGMCRLLI